MTIWLAQAEMSLEDFFKSTRESVGEGPRMSFLIALIVLSAVLLVLLVILNRRQKKEASIKPTNNMGKLQRDMLEMLKITKEEAKELDRVAKESGMTSCLSLLLCPSKLQKAAQSAESDSRRILTGLIKRICA